MCSYHCAEDLWEHIKKGEDTIFGIKQLKKIKSERVEKVTRSWVCAKVRECGGDYAAKMFRKQNDKCFGEMMEKYSHRSKH